MKKILILALAATAGLDLIPTSEATASETAPATQAAVAALPATLSNNYVVIREGGRRYYRRRHVIIVNGRRRVTYERVWL